MKIAGLSRESRGTVALLRRTVGRLRRTFKKARIRVRLDAGFACPQVFDVLEELRVEYLVAMPENSALTLSLALLAIRERRSASRSRP